MAEFQEVMRNYHRMCESATTCEDCALNEAINEIQRTKDMLGTRIASCAQYIEYFPNKAEEIIQHWAAEHPEKPKKTMLEVLKEHFPKVAQDDNKPHFCPSAIFGDEYGTSCGKISCAECWNRPVPDEYQEKDE